MRKRTEAESRVEVRSLNRVYVQNGFPDRKTYLQSLADYFGLPLDMVVSIANKLGATKDFTALLDECAKENQRIETAFAFEQAGV